MRASRISALLVGSLSIAAAACSGTARAGEGEQAVRDVVQSLEDAVNAREWQAFFANFTEGGDLVVFESPRAEGRAAARALMEAGWSETPADVRAELTVSSVRFVTPEVAIVDVDAQFAGSQPSRDRAIAVLTSYDGVWLIDAFRVMQPEARPFDAASPDAVTADAEHYSVEFENSLVRVLRVGYEPGATSILHSHPAACAIYVTEGTFEFTLPDGTTSDGTLTEAGNVTCIDSDVHNPTNIGDAPVELVLVELKNRGTFGP